MGALLAGAGRALCYAVMAGFAAGMLALCVVILAGEAHVALALLRWLLGAL